MRVKSKTADRLFQNKIKTLLRPCLTLVMNMILQDHFCQEHLIQIDLIWSKLNQCDPTRSNYIQLDAIWSNKKNNKVSLRTLELNSCGQKITHPAMGKLHIYLYRRLPDQPLQEFWLSLLRLRSTYNLWSSCNQINRIYS